MPSQTPQIELPARSRSLVMSKSASFWKRVGRMVGQSFLFLVTSLSSLAVLFIFIFIAKDAIPFFLTPDGKALYLDVIKQFFTSDQWYPARDPGLFGAAGIFYGSIMVTIGSAVVAVPLGISAAVCLSDVLPFNLRQMVKPVIEILAAIPSVAYGFFALVVFAPLLQEKGGPILSVEIGRAHV